MQVHRSRHVRGFTALPNYLLQDRGLSYTARGLLADLLSRPDGWREDGRQMADSSPQGRIAVAKALRELTRAGYYRVEKLRQPDGTVISQSHVYDTPELPVSDARKVVSGERSTGRADVLPKNRAKEPSLPAVRPVDPSADGGVPEPTVHAVTEIGSEVRDAVALLFRVLRPEPRLRLGAVEALALAPLVVGWLKLGASERDLAAALLPGLPGRILAPAGLLRDRLTRKRPPAPAPAPDPNPQPVVLARRWSECAKCADPVRQPGICRACAGLVPHPPAVGTGSTATARGVALARAALRGTGCAAPTRTCARVP